MKTTDFDYQLPPELIAYYPPEQRTASRLMCIDGDHLTHRKFSDLIDLLTPNDLLVMNNSKVIPARLFGVKPTGGKVEILIERLLTEHEALVHMKASKAAKAGDRIVISESPRLDRGVHVEKMGPAVKPRGCTEIEILSRDNELFKIKFLSDKPILDLLDLYGHIPLPPYIERNDESFDIDRYQTVYAKTPGSVAAPTAGLHFDEVLLQKIKDKSVSVGFVTLHVGAGTFQPVRVDNIHDHKMHAEWISVSKELCDQIYETKRKGGRIIAVGTTSVRCLETAASKRDYHAFQARSHDAVSSQAERGDPKDIILPYEGETDIFITPGFQFRCVDGLITNFHLPKSTLLMLVSAFAGKDVILKAYKEAIEKKYRFYSYGDAMFIF